MWPICDTNPRLKNETSGYDSTKSPTLSKVTTNPEKKMLEKDMFTSTIAQQTPSIWSQRKINPG